MSNYSNPAGPKPYEPANSSVNASPNFDYGPITTAGYNTDMVTPKGSGIGQSLMSGLLGGASGLMGGAMNLIGGLLNQRAQRKENEKARQFQTSEREAQNQWNLDMWNRQNEYNTPAAQMQRMLEAGINPAAAAQGISGSGSTAGSVQGASNGGASNNAMPDNGIGRLGDSIGNSANSALGWSGVLNAGIEREGKSLDNVQKQVDIKKGLLEGDLLDEQIYAAGLDNYVNDVTAESKIDGLMAENEGKEFDTIIKGYGAYIKRMTAGTEVSQIIANYDKTIKETQNLIDQGTKLRADVDAIRQSIKESKARVALLEEQKKQTMEQTAILQIEKEIANENRTIKGFEREQKSMETDLKTIEHKFYMNMGYTGSMSDHDKVSAYFGKHDIMNEDGSVNWEKAGYAVNVVHSVYGDDGMTLIEMLNDNRQRRKDRQAQKEEGKENRENQKQIKEMAIKAAKAAATKGKGK